MSSEEMDATNSVKPRAKPRGRPKGALNKTPAAGNKEKYRTYNKKRDKAKRNANARANRKKNTPSL